MSEYPPPYDPNPQYVPYANPVSLRPKKPVSVMVIGIIAICLGAIALLCSPIAIFGAMAPQPAGAANANPMLGTPALRNYTIATYVLGLMTSVWLLAAGIGSVMLKRWGRSSMVGYAWASLVILVITTILNIAWVFPATWESLKSSQLAPGMSPEMMMVFMVGGGVIGFLFGLVLPICILVFFRRPHVVQAFETGGMASM